MSSPLTLENCLILACARTAPDVPRIQELVERCPDWQGILRKAERWGLAPLVYSNLRQAARSGQVPKPVAERLRYFYHRDTIHGVARRELLRATLLRFSEASVPVIVLKGAALAALVYPSAALRPMGYLDLLVHSRDLDRVDELLRAMRNAHHVIPYLGPEGFSLLNVRTHIFSPSNSADPLPAPAHIPIEDFWERARPAQIESVSTLVFSHEDLLLHLALHLVYARGFAGQVKTLCDIGEVCRRCGDAIDWSQLVVRARAYEMEKPLYYALCSAQELVGAEVPSWTPTELRASFGQLPLEERFIAAIARRAIVSEDQGAGPFSMSYRFGVRLLAIQRARDGVMMACHHLGRSCRVHLRRLVIWPGPSRPRVSNSGSSDLSREAGPSEAPSSGVSRTLSAQVGEVAVTYENQTTTDGVGSQLLRIYGLYALSRALQIKYVHTPLGRVDYQGFLPLLTGSSDPDFAARYNAFFSLPSDDFDLESCERVRIHILCRETVERYREHAAGTGRPVLLQAIHHYGYTDRHPAAFHTLRTVSPYRRHRAAGPIRVCIHMRRGDVSVPGRTDGQQRLLSDSYYLRVCGTVLEVLRQQGAPFVVRLHTEVPPRRYTLYPDTPGLFFRLDGPGTVDPSEYTLKDFEALPNVEMVLNVEAREALDDFATADVLILSLSSLGYLGGLLNPHGLVIYAPWWHPPMPDWLVADEHGNLNTEEVATRIADLLRPRGSWSTAFSLQ